jgi:hypothetical protein
MIARGLQAHFGMAFLTPLDNSHQPQPELLHLPSAIIVTAIGVTRPPLLQQWLK